MIKGSCLCGRVAYEIAGPLTDVVNCHCGMCRKAHGAAFRTRATVQAADFKWTRGENHITWYCSSPGNYRGFCEACGTPLLSRLDQTPEVMDCRWARWTMIPACGHRRIATWPTARPGSRSPTTCPGMKARWKRRRNPILAASPRCGSARPRRAQAPFTN